MRGGPLVVTGAGGRLGRVLLEQLRKAGRDVVAWSRPDYDLDDPDAARRLVRRNRPAAVIHAAAWVDVDGCANEPALARRRNAEACGELAEALAGIDADLVLLSTNEVFDGSRTDGHGYREDDEPNPANPYGASKLEGERRARAAYADPEGPRLWIVRTAWLYGPAGNDFPAKILAAAKRDVPLRVVDDEFGNPTSTEDLSAALIRLPQAAPPGTYHVAAPDHCSRHAWASDLIAHRRPGTPIAAISSSDFERASRPPAWGVLDSTLAAVHGIGVRSWAAAAPDYREPG